MSDSQTDSETGCFSCLMATIGGVGFIWLTVGLASEIAPSRFWTALAVVFCGSILCAAVGLSFFVRRAMRIKNQVHQFSIAELFLLTVLAAIYLALVRWMAHVVAFPEVGEPTIYAVSAFTWLLLVMFAVPFVLGASACLIWLGVWAVRRPRVRRWLARRRES